MQLQLISQTVRPTTAITRNHLSLSHELLAYLVAAIAITIRVNHSFTDELVLSLP
jgi:hypothetical protein